MQVISNVRRFIRQHDLMRPGTHVVCAVSGGSDSVALSRIVAALDAASELRFVGLTHLNHQLRPTADRDEQFCRDLANELRRPIVVERTDIAADAEASGRSMESAAHEARYALFARAARELDGEVVALGHTRDDQAETFLLRLLRGAGPRGLGAMYPRNGLVVRPLLDCSRGDLREFLSERGSRFMDDETNEDLAIPRNRIRTELLPRLAADFNPNVVEVLAREADVARDIWSWLERELERFGLDLDVDRLRAAPVALRRLALWRAMNDRGAGHVITASHVDAALGLIDAREGATVDAPGIRVHRIGSLIVLTDRTENPGKNENPSNFWRFPLSIPGEVTAHDMTLSAELAPGGPAGLPPGAEVGTGLVAAVRADLLADGLAVRNRRAGDRFRPVGLNGRKKLQDFFVDRKIVRSQRDLVPVVVDDRDQIVWVAGHRIDEAFRVTDASQGMVVLKLRYLHATVQEPRGGDPVERCS